MLWSSVKKWEAGEKGTTSNRTMCRARHAYHTFPKEVFALVESGSGSHNKSQRLPRICLPGQGPCDWSLRKHTTLHIEAPLCTPQCHLDLCTYFPQDLRLLHVCDVLRPPQRVPCMRSFWLQSSVQPRLICFKAVWEPQPCGQCEV